MFKFTLSLFELDTIPIVCYEDIVKGTPRQLWIHNFLENISGIK